MADEEEAKILSEEPMPEADLPKGVAHTVAPPEFAQPVAAPILANPTPVSTPPPPPPHLDPIAVPEPHQSFKLPETLPEPTPVQPPLSAPAPMSVPTPTPVSEPMPVPTPAPVHHDAVAKVEHDRPKRPVGKIIGITLGSLVGILVLLLGGSALAYRFMPQTFFRIVPASISASINSLWPLHSDFSQMVPTNSVAFVTINYATSSQSQQLQTLLNRMPGLHDATTNAQKTATDYLNSQYGVSLDNDIKPVFDSNIYFVLPSDVGSGSSLTAGVHIKDLTKAKALLQKLQQGTGKSKSVFYTQQTYNGVTAYLVQPVAIPITTPLGSGTLQTLGKSSKPCISSSIVACAADSNTTDISKYPSFAVVDNYLVFTDTFAHMKGFIDFNHRRQKGLDSSASFSKVSQAKSSSLASVYVNIPQLMQDLKVDAATAGTIVKGLQSVSGTLIATNVGFALHGAAYYDSSIDPDTAAILQAPDADSTFAKTVPASTAFFSESSGMSHLLNALSKDNTVETDAKNSLGIGLADLSKAFGNRYAFSYQPDQQSAVVMQAEVGDATTLATDLDKITTTLIQASGGALTASTDTSNGATVTSFKVTDPALAAYQKYLQPAFAIKGTTFIFSSNVAGLQSVLTAPTSTLASDTQMQSDLKIVGTKNSGFEYFNTKRIYNGVVSTIRDVTSNPDLAVSDQEKVIDAYLTIFPSFTFAAHPSSDVLTSDAIIPVVALPADQNAQIEALIKNDPNSIFNFAPFVSAVEPSATNASFDDQRKSDIATIAKAIVTNESNKSDFSDFISTGSEKLGPDNPHIKKLIAAGDLKEVLIDPDWPNYYYTLDSDGKSIKVTALLEQKPADNTSCEPTKQIRGRWTFCVSQK